MEELDKQFSGLDSFLSASKARIAATDGGADAARAAATLKAHEEAYLAHANQLALARAYQAASVKAKLASAQLDVEFFRYVISALSFQNAKIELKLKHLEGLDAAIAAERQTTRESQR